MLKKWSPITTIVAQAPDAFRMIILFIWIFGYGFLLTSTFAIDHFELFGLRQGLKMGKFLRFVPDGFVTIAHYKLVRIGFNI